MACGSVVHKEGRLSREIGSTKLNRSNSPSENGSNAGSGRNNYLRNPFDRGDVHEAIKFLQEEHAKVLTGLHKQIEAFQRRSDDFHFDTHLRHVLTNEEEVLKLKLKEMSKKMEDKVKQTQELELLLQEREKLLEEEKQQHRWKEVQLQQKIEVYEQRSMESKAEVQRLNAQVRDLQVYCSGIRASEESRASHRQSHGRSPVWSPRAMMMSNGPLRSSQESLDSFGPRSIGSEDGDTGAWREARLGGSMNDRFIPSRASRAVSSPSCSIGGGINLNHSQSSLFPISGTSRPSSGSVVLPPIAHSQAITRPQVRKQLRLFSAPNLDSTIKSKNPKQPP